MKHERICQGLKKRKPFDSSKQRTEELPKDIVKTSTKTQSELPSRVKKVINSEFFFCGIYFLT